MDVDQPAHPLPREGSSSEYSSSSSSPMGIQTREESSDSAEENERRKRKQPPRVPVSPGFVFIRVSIPRFRDSLGWFGKGEAGDVAEPFHFELCQTHGSGLTGAERHGLQSIRPPRSAHANDVSGLPSYHPHPDAKFGAQIRPRQCRHEATFIVYAFSFIFRRKK